MFCLLFLHPFVTQTLHMASAGSQHCNTELFAFFIRAFFSFVFCPFWSLVTRTLHTLHFAEVYAHTGDCQQHCQEMINGFLWPVVIFSAVTAGGRVVDHNNPITIIALWLRQSR